MPIVGPISEFPLSEIFNMVGHSTGRLRFPGRPEVEIHVVQGFFRAVLVQGNPLHDRLHMHDVLARIEGERELFEFYREESEHLRSDFRISIAATLMNVACFMDELVMHRHSLPETSLHFKLSDHPHAPVEGELAIFLKRARQFLEEGTDAEWLSDELKLSLSRMRLYLLKLRQAGVVVEYDPAQDPIGGTKLLLIEPNREAAERIKRRLGKSISCVAVVAGAEAAMTFLGSNFPFNVIACGLDGAEADQLLHWLIAERKMEIRFLAVTDSLDGHPSALPRIFGPADLRAKLVNGTAVLPIGEISPLPEPTPAA